MNHKELTAQYPDFYFDAVEIQEDASSVSLCYHFKIGGLAEFRPTWSFPKPQGVSVAGDAAFRALAFSLGMAELVSYWKPTCSPSIHVAFPLSEAQVNWWKKLYYFGLGEFFYRNGIAVDAGSYVNIYAQPPQGPAAGAYPAEALSGMLVPVGGGKDSVVTLAWTRPLRKDSCCYMINSRASSAEAARLAGYSPQQVLVPTRRLDTKIVELNQQGFLNGHTPFSAIVAFSSLLCAYLWKKKYIVLSNESSANEATVKGTDVNHQYSKSYEFERDFAEYVGEYLPYGIQYFSFLRPFSELQIACLFAREKQYHRVFKSCNVGSKQDVWCGKCSKCLFVFGILSPFIPLAELVDIFGRNLLEDDTLWPVLEQLIGETDSKPFECVGSRDEINFALCETVQSLESVQETLPILLQRYKASPFYAEYASRQNPYYGYFDAENSIPAVFGGIIEEMRGVLHEKG